MCVVFELSLITYTDFSVLLGVSQIHTKTHTHTSENGQKYNTRRLLLKVACRIQSIACLKWKPNLRHQFGIKTMNQLAHVCNITVQNVRILQFISIYLDSAGESRCVECRAIGITAEIEPQCVGRFGVMEHLSHMDVYGGGNWNY